MPPSIDLHEYNRMARELAYYKGEFATLGARMSRANSELTHALADANRARSLTSLVLSTSMIADFGGPEADVNEMLLSKIIGCAECDRGMLLRSSRIDASERFEVIAALGTGGKHQEILELRSAPEFLYTTDLLSGEEPVLSSEMVMALSELRNFVGVKYILWGYDPIGQVALLLGKQYESGLSRGFRKEDSELTRAALGVYLDTHHRKNSAFERSLVEEPDTDVALATALPARKASGGIPECDIHEGLRRGGKIVGFIVVDRSIGQNIEFVAYVRASWSRQYQVLRRARDNGERVYRDLARLLHNARFDFGFQAPVVTYAAGMPELRRFEGILQRDRTPLADNFEDDSVGSSETGSILGAPLRPRKPLDTRS